MPLPVSSSAMSPSAEPASTTLAADTAMDSSSADEVSSTAPIAHATSNSHTPSHRSDAKETSETVSVSPSAENAAVATGVQDTTTHENRSLPPTPSSPSQIPADSAPQSAEAEPKSQISASPSRSLTITVLLQSGARQQFNLNQAYLERHSVKSPVSGKEQLTDPLEMSVLQLKECIWKDWREDWDQRPASALYLKLIQFGAYMVDTHPLKDCRLSPDGPNVIHMAIRPVDVGDDEVTQRSTKGGFGHSRDRDGGGRSPSCRCVIL